MQYTCICCQDPRRSTSIVTPSWPSFLIDLDLAIKETRREASGAKGKTGTRAFMAIGALCGEQHSFMHDLESMFWVLFWICVHYDGPNHERVVLQFDKWNYVDMKKLALLKIGTVMGEADFMKTVTDNFTSYFKPLIPLLNRLRKIVFPNNERYKQEDESLYRRMKELLQNACKDLTLMDKRDERDTQSSHQEPAIMTQ